MITMQRKTQCIRWCALFFHLGLMIFIGSWQLTLSPHIHFSPWIITLLWLVPLCLPLKGLLAAKPYTHAWANFILMFYFLHALTLITVDENERILAIIELMIVIASFISNILFARLRGAELGHKLKRLSQVEQEERQRYQS